MLRLYRRHLITCKFRTGGKGGSNCRRHLNCKCPVWVDGTLQGEKINRSLKLRDWGRANEIIRDWEIARCVTDEMKSAVPIRKACDAFLDDAKVRFLRDSSIKKYQVLLVNQRKPKDRDRFSPSLCEFCAAKSVQFTSQIKLDLLNQFRAEWKDHALSASKKLERLKAFGRFLVDHGWWKDNLAKKLRRPVVKDAPTMPYSTEEVAAMLAACNDFPDSHHHTGRDNAKRLRAFVLFLRYSALRITDAASCDVERLTGNKLFLYTQKTGVPVYIPLPPFVVDALNACTRMNPKHWFWIGEGSKATLAENWRRTFRRLCARASVQNGHPHRFRDTLAVELLLEDVPMERVSILLGHSSIKITQKHYAPWVHARQAQLEADLARVWRKDPLAQQAMLQPDSASKPLLREQPTGVAIQ
jgi:integrase/recombinase XerD